jgi:S1-C subfamily serine protease
MGAEIIRVEPASAGNRAGLVAGDVLTLIDDIEAPTAVQVTRSFAALREGQRVMVAVTRSAAHFVTTLER